MKRIKYIVSYDTQMNSEENRVNVLASSNKIDYIVSVLNELGYAVDLVSTSQTLNKKCYGGKQVTIGKNKLILFPTTWRGGLLCKILNAIIMRFSIWNYLRKNIINNEKVIIYHSLGNLWILKYLRKHTKAYIIEEVEEIYGEIFGNQRQANKEKRELQIADAYIYPTVLIDRIVNHLRKPSLVIHGAYVNTDYNRMMQADSVVVTENGQNFMESEYHVGYTGILDPKKGCLSIVRAGEFLDETFHIHILGFGSENEIEMLENCIRETRKKTKCVISFDGVRRGVAYENYLQLLNLGICPVDSSQDFVLSQFPSKIISYMTNGLPVLCSNIESVRTSDVTEGVVFYEGDNPKDIAKAIMQAKEQLFNVNTEKIMAECDAKFKNEIDKMLKES